MHSQFGEDGIIEEILARLGISPASLGRPIWCVEFGAWDGMHLSNCRRLVEEEAAHAVLIEPHPDRFADLERNCLGFAGQHPIRAMVTIEGDTSLPRLLRSTPCPRDFELLSIDVDGYDYHLWNAFKGGRPTVVVCEYNPTFPYEMIYTPPGDPRVRHGCSLGALRDLGREKGYELAAVTDTNGIFVTQERFPELGIEDNSLRTLTQGLPDFRTILFQTPDGEIMMTGNHTVLWHQVLMDVRRTQQIPWYLRGDPETFGPLRKALLNRLRARRKRAFRKAYGIAA